MPLTEISSIAASSSGRIAVADDQTRGVIIFSAEGGFERVIGRSGDGPGEFRDVSGVLFMGDTLWAVDSELRRGQYFGPDGSLLRTVTFNRDLGHMFGSAMPLGERYIFWPGLAAPSVVAEEGYRMPLLLLDSDAEQHGSFGPLLRQNILGMMDMPGGGSMFMRLPLPNADYAALSPGGTHLILANGAVDREGQRSVLVTKIAAAGDTVFTRRYALGALEVPSEYQDREFNKLLEQVGSRFSTRGAARQALQRAWRVSTQLWPVHGLLVAADGRIWIHTNPLTNEWMRLDQAGRVEGCALAPAGVTLRAALGRHAWGERLDELGVPTIHRFDMGI